MIEPIALSLVGIQLVLFGWVWYRQARWNQDSKGWVADAVEEALRRQDDRIRKRIERSDGTEAGLPPETNGTVRPGVTVGR
jgi:uncharacterized membrane protein